MIQPLCSPAVMILRGWRTEECWIIPDGSVCTSCRYCEAAGIVCGKYVTWRNPLVEILISYRHRPFITPGSACVARLRGDDPELLAALQEKEPSLANKWVTTLDISPSMGLFDI